MAEPVGYGLHQRRIGKALRLGGGREAGRDDDAATLVALGHHLMEQL